MSSISDLTRQVLDRRWREVAMWECRRLARSRQTLLLAVGGAVTFGAVLANYHRSLWVTDLDGHRSVHLLVSTGTAWGYSYGLRFAMIFAGVFIPFITADGVAIDLQLRTHELIMATGIPSGAYVFGRWLARLSLSMGLAIVLLVTSIGVSISTERTTLGLGSILGLWAFVAVPQVLLLAVVAFAIGTLWPRRPTSAALGVAMGWLCLVTFSGALDTAGRRDLAALEPTASKLGQMIGTDYQNELLRRVPRLSLSRLPPSSRDVDPLSPDAALSDPRLQSIDRAFRAVSWMPPTFSGLWSGRFVLLGLVAIILTIAVWRFGRFQQVL